MSDEKVYDALQQLPLDIWHYMHLPGEAICSADYTNMKKTANRENVTCPFCLKRMLFQQAADIEAATPITAGNVWHVHKKVLCSGCKQFIEGAEGAPTNAWCDGCYLRGVESRPAENELRNYILQKLNLTIGELRGTSENEGDIYQSFAEDLEAVRAEIINGKYRGYLK